MFSVFDAVQIKIYAKRLLTLVLCIPSILLVWDLCLKFYHGATTLTVEQIDEDYLSLPPILLCSKRAYKKEELSAMGLPQNFLYERDRSKASRPEPFPDLKETWHKATWSNEDLQVEWSRYEGTVMTRETEYFPQPYIKILYKIVL